MLDATQADRDSPYFNPTWSAERLTAEQRRQLPAALTVARQNLEPCSTHDLDRLRDALDLIGVRISPTLGEESETWRDATLTSLSRVPADILTIVIERASFKQFKALWDVGPWIEAEATPLMQTRRLIAHRIERLIAHQPATPSEPFDTAAILQDVAKEMAAKGKPIRPVYEKTAKPMPKLPPAGGYMLADANAEKAAIVEQVNQLDRLRAGVGHGAMTKTEKNAAFKRIKAARAKSGTDPKNHTPRAEAA